MRLRAKSYIGEQALVRAGAGAYWKVGRMEHERGGIESNDHPPRSKSHGIQLHRIQVDQLDARVGGGGVADFDNRDRGLGTLTAGSTLFAILRNSDRRY